MLGWPAAGAPVAGRGVVVATAARDAVPCGGVDRPAPCATGPSRYAPSPASTQTITPKASRRPSGLISICRLLPPHRPQPERNWAVSLGWRPRQRATHCLAFPWRSGTLRRSRLAGGLAVPVSLALSAVRLALGGLALAGLALSGLARRCGPRGAPEAQATAPRRLAGRLALWPLGPWLPAGGLCPLWLPVPGLRLAPGRLRPASLLRLRPRRPRLRRPRLRRPTRLRPGRLRPRRLRPGRLALPWLPGPRLLRLRNLAGGRLRWNRLADS